MAEIVEEADEEYKKLQEQEDEETQATQPISQTGPDLNSENTLKAFAQFAGTQKVSVISLIKLLIPTIEGQTVIVTMTRQQEEFIGDIKIQWQAFLREYFCDPSIVLQIRIDEKADTKRQAYTPSEQFKEMLDTSETFRQFVNRLKLKLKS